MYKAIKKSEIPGLQQCRTGKINSELKDFMATSFEAAEIVVPANRPSKAIYQSYYRAVKRLGLPIRVGQRGDKIYIWKEGKK